MVNMFYTLSVTVGIRIGENREDEWPVSSFDVISYSQLRRDNNTVMALRNG